MDGIFLSWGSCHLPVSNWRPFVGIVVGALPHFTTLLPLSFTVPTTTLLVSSLQSQSQSIYPPSLVYIHPRLYKPQLRGCWSSSHGRSKRSWRCRWRSDSLFLTAFFVWRSPEVVFRRDLFLYALIKLLNIHCPGLRSRIWSTRRWLEMEYSIHSLPWLILLVIT